MKRTILVLTIVLVVKMLYLLFAYLTVNNGNISVFKNNDSYWYETIAVNGHQKITPDKLGKCEEGHLEQSYYAFFPLYPLVIGITMKLTGLSFNLVAFFYSLVFSLAMFVTFYKFTRKVSGNEQLAFHSTLVLLLFPFHYYFSVFYTESLFLLLLLGAFYALEVKRMFVFAVMACLLVLSRPNGLFMLIPLYLYFLEKNHGNKVVDWFRLPFKIILNGLYFVFPVLLFVAYCFYLKWMTGDFFAYKTAQAGWCRETVWPWVPILRSSNWMDYFNSIYLIGFIAITIIYLKKLPLSYISFIGISLLLPLTANSITSPRFISVIFVFSLLIGEAISRNKIRTNIAVYLILLSAQLASFYFWLINSSFSY